MDRSNNTIKTAISLQGISKFYKDNTVIDNISLELAKGEFLSLLGPSGSGKTTMLRMVAGLVMPDKGKVVLKEQDVSQVPPNKRNLGMVFQQYALFPHMTVWENVAYGLKARKMKGSAVKEKVEKYLELVGLEHLAQRKPKQLSGGQQQRVSLARALAVEPVVMLFDEPLSNLDARLKEQMQLEIRNLHRKLGFSAVYVTHDQNEALFLSDKIALLNKGKVEQFGSPEEVLSRPVSPFVADFFGYTNSLPNAVLLDENNATVNGIKVPIGHCGPECKRGDKGIILMRFRAIQVHDYNKKLNVFDEIDGNMLISEAKVLDSRYLGGETELQLHLSENTESKITAICPRMMRPLPENGEIIKISFNADAIAFFKE
jgi:ABC-type Fe3+/spermidine/putrescine transport system ATPase subunit